MPTLLLIFVAGPSLLAGIEYEQFMEASRTEHYRYLNWKPVLSWDFESGKIPEDFQVISGDWEVSDGMLQAVGGEEEGNRLILLTPAAYPTFRIEFDATLHPGEQDEIGDLIIRLNADPETGSFARGYAAILGHFYNQTSTFYRLNIPVARTEWSPLVPGQTHRVVLDCISWSNRAGNHVHIRYWVDGRVVLDFWDRNQGQPMEPERMIGISTYDTHLTIDNLSISVPSP